MLHRFFHILLINLVTCDYFLIELLKADVEVLFELPDLQSAELLEPSEVDPQILSSEQYVSRKGMIGPFGLQVLASKDQTERTTISFRIYRVVDRYICLMISDPSRLLFYTLQTQF
jgi:beta-fructofuranosidase